MEFPWGDREAIRRYWHLILNTATDIAQFPQLGDNLMLCTDDLLEAHATTNLLEPLFDASLEKPNHRSSFVFASCAEKMKLSTIFGPPKCDYAIFVIQREHFS
jgi:hypothetical protein